MRNELGTLETPIIMTSMMGAIYGAVKTFDKDITLPEIFGLSGHGFILNIERDLCATGPTAWDWGAILFPLRQMYNLRRLCANCDMRSIDEAKELIWERTIENIDKGYPVVLWDALNLEFYTCRGYDTDTDEYIIDGPGAKKANNVVKSADLGIRSGQVWALFPKESEHQDKENARDLALKGAINWYNWKNDKDAQWVFGGEAWDTWIEAMKAEEMPADPKAIATNHFTYHECRQNAAIFLEGCGEKYADAAIAYKQVANALDKACKLWGINDPTPSYDVRLQIVDLLMLAKFAEKEGIKALNAIYTK